MSQKAGTERGSLAKRIIADATSNRSGVYRWLRENYTEVAKAIPVRGSWDALRRAAIEAEITTRKGLPTVAALRSAWLRVVADVERTGGHKSSRRTTSPAPTRPGKTQPTATAIAGTPIAGTTQPDDHEPAPKFTFRPTRLR